MTTEQHEIVAALRTIDLPFGADWDKSFIAQMYFSKPSFVISEKQNICIFRLLYKYRAQLPALYEKHKDNEFCKPKPKTT